MQKKVLFIINALTGGGMENVVLGILNAMEQGQYKADILTFYERDMSQAYKFRKYNCKIYQIPRISRGLLGFICNCRYLIKKNNYMYVHTLIDFAGILVCVASIGTKTKIICHSHNNKWIQIHNKLLQKTIQKMFRLFSCKLVAVSKEAGNYLFGTGKKEITIINNGIDLSKYKYDSHIRKSIRQKYNVNDKLVLGNVGRLALQKNPKKQLEIIEEILKKNENIEYWMIGDGEIKEDIKNMIIEKNLSEKVRMFGHRNDIPQLLQAMDIFILPSFNEGFPIALLEAQCSGLICFVSDAVPMEANVTGNVHYLNLDTSSEIWANEILKLQNGYLRQDQSYQLEKAGYDYNITYKQYLKLMQ